MRNLSVSVCQVYILIAYQLTVSLQSHKITCADGIYLADSVTFRLWYF